ncbi:hypothetical protein Cni_G07017 [Canna indica]|uniref:Aminotransferase-like plant mobile domain-containing protein n=1 Tax=Canna indica TaxID=4628 RepID=A0AAQ3JY79_9LILI|nr:hypothetical protein Cni_G07017 [Canna indica]
MKQWVKDLVFNFKGKEVTFSESNVALLLGLPNHGEIIPTLEASEATCEGYMKAKFFSDGAAPSRTQIEDIMIQVHGSNNPQDIEDFCRLYILYVFSYNLNDISKYNWSNCIYSSVVGQIPSIGERIRLVVEQQQANPAATYMRGCVILLLGWFFEHIPILVPRAIPNKHRLWK